MHERNEDDALRPNHTVQLRLATVVARLVDGNGRLPVHQIRPEAFGTPLLPHLLLWDLGPPADPTDFRHRLCGTSVTEVIGVELTGTTVAEHPVSALGATWSHGLGLALERRLAVFSRVVFTHADPDGQSRWETSIWPAWREDGIHRFLGIVTREADWEEAKALTANPPARTAERYRLLETPTEF